MIFGIVDQLVRRKKLGCFRRLLNAAVYCDPHGKKLHQGRDRAGKTELLNLGVTGLSSIRADLAD